jgi:hypothetical protein
MAAGLNGASATARQQNRQVVVRMSVPVREAAAVYDHAIIEQGSISLGDRLELVRK